MNDALECHCVSDASHRLHHRRAVQFSCCSSDLHAREHATLVWDCCFLDLEESVSHNTPNHWIKGGKRCSTFEERRERLAEIMLGIIPLSLGGDVRDWEKADESETMVHNMVSTSVVHGSEMPINLSQLAMMLPCSTYDRKRFAAITIRIDNPRCTALLFTSGKLVITGVKSW